MLLFLLAFVYLCTSPARLLLWFCVLSIPTNQLNNGNQLILPLIFLYYPLFVFVSFQSTLPQKMETGKNAGCVSIILLTTLLTLLLSWLVCKTE